LLTIESLRYNSQPAYLFFGSKRNRTNAAASVFVQAIGGIHEVYFPFVLLDPWVLLGPIVGGFSGTLIFQFLGVGLRAPASPGSILAILLNTPPSMILGVLAGIIVSTVVSFAIASVLLKRIRFEPKKRYAAKTPNPGPGLASIKNKTD